LITGIAVALVLDRFFWKENTMYLDLLIKYLNLIITLLVVVSIPIFAVVIFLGIAKKRRHRRPVGNFR
jgi:predicted membrane-bound mannosyltransferase